MNTLLIVGLLTVYLVTCAGYYKSFVNGKEFMKLTYELNPYGVQVALVMCSVTWPIVMVVTLFFKGVSK